MTQRQIDLIEKEQDQFLTLEMGLITQFMKVEQKQINYPSFPLSKVTEDLEKELDLDLSHNVNEIQQTLMSHVFYRKVYCPAKVKAQIF